MTKHARNDVRDDAGEAPRVVPLRAADGGDGAKEPLWRQVVGDVLRRERLAQERTLKDVAEVARISMPYLSEVERGLKEASSEVLASAAHALGLGLADLLVRSHGEIVRLTGVRTLPHRQADTEPAVPAGVRTVSEMRAVRRAQAAWGAQSGHAVPRAGSDRYGDVRLAA